MYTYSLVQWVLVFYIYCFLGWCFESTVVSVQQRRFVNRGFIRGPMLPLYGTGAVLLLWVALPLEGRSPVLLFLAGMAATTLLEYVTGVVMESIFKVKYWDYSAHKFQFQGRVCLQSSLAWGALTLLLTAFIHPPVERLVLWLPPFAALLIAGVLSVLFLSDVVFAVRTALDLARVLDELTRLRAQADELRVQLSLLKSETRDRLEEAADETRGRIAGARGRLADAAEDRRRRLQDAADAATAAYEDRLRRMRRTSKWLVRAHPSAASRKFGRALEELKERLGQR